MFKNSETFVPLSALGTRPTPYKKTHDYTGDYINEHHRYYSSCPLGGMGIAVCIDIGVEGYLQQADALKIYEMAYFCKGNILELGTHKGLSTSIIAQALDDAKNPAFMDTVDIDEPANLLAKRNVGARPGNSHVSFHLQDAAEYMDAAIITNSVYDFIFIDHWHGFEATFDAALRAKKLLNEGGFCLFHDYNDPGNADPKHPYGVYQASHEVMLSDSRFEFFGTFGCCGLFRKVRS